MKLHLLAFASLFAALSGMAACSGSTANPAPTSSSSSSGSGDDGGSTSSSSSGGSSSSSSSSGGSSGSSGQCNTLTQEGGSVTATANPAAAPAAVGGTAPDGKYVLTSLVFYNTARPFPVTTKITIEKKGTTLDALTTDSKGDARATSTVTLAGTDLTLMETCSFPAKDDGGTKTDKGTFTATATELKLYSTLGAATVEQTYTKK